MDRTHLIGSTDIATILGLGYESQAHLWLRLTGAIGDDDDTRNATALRAGQLAEEGLFKPLITERIGRQLTRIAPHTLPDEPRIGASFDFTNDDLGPVRLDECKLTGSTALWENGDVPPLYLAQLQFQLAVLRANGILVDEAGIWQLQVPGWHLHYHPVKEDQQVGQAMIAKAKQFLRLVDTGVPPTPTDEDDVRRLVIASQGKKFICSQEQAEILYAIRGFQEQAKHFEALAKENRDRLIPMIGDATELVDSTGKPLGTFRANRAFDEEAFHINYPELAAAYVKVSTDMKRLRAERPDVVDACMGLPTDSTKQVRVLRIKGGK